MVAHEYAHADAAYRQGDPTAYMLGRLTLNPLKHIDPFMTILLPIAMWVQSGGRFAFGGAKPVPVNPRNYRNFVRVDIIGSLPGVVVILGLFVVSALLVAVLGGVGAGLPGTAGTLAILPTMAKLRM